ncbi:tetratricopeptide repeat protein [Flagellimonas marinaquae]|uniref:tetratricopeptide repeat protein n=1 Tax=Flagellimonas marinaquae TaxID=254955 RepID=UPI000F8F478C|nr:hypothetical protein [Allomuricauda aquimarina]
MPLFIHNKQLRGFLIFFLFFSILFSCNSDTADNLEPTPSAKFDPVIADSEFSGIDLESKWRYLLRVIEGDYENLGDLESWFLEKINKLKDADHLPDPDVLRRLNRRTLVLDLNDAGFSLAHFTRNAEQNAYKSSMDVANAILVNRYVFFQTIDSLSIYLDEMESHLDSESEPFVIMTYFNGKAVRANLEGKLFESVVNYKKALNYAPEENLYNRYVLHLNIASMYNDFDFDEKAKYHADKAVELVGLDGISERSMNLLGVIESKSGNLERAEMIFNRAIGFGLKTKRVDILAPAYANYGNLKRKQGKFRDALENIAKSDSICNVYGIDIGLIINRINRAEVYYSQGRFQDALQELEQTYAQVKDVNLTYLSIGFLELRYKIYDGLGDIASADRNFREYIRLKEAHQGDISRSAVSEWELATERETAQRLSDQYKLELENEVKRKYRIAFVLTAVLLLMTLVFFAKYRQRSREREKLHKERLQLQFELEGKSRELLSESLNNLTVKNTKDDILGDLEVILNQLPEKFRKQFSGLTYKLNSGKDYNFLEEFEQRFTGVYESFNQKILDLAPDLTPNELKVCAFIRLNMTTKDIARLTGKSLGTVENTRILIRKKLNLSSDDNLQQFLLRL